MIIIKLFNPTDLNGKPVIVYHITPSSNKNFLKVFSHVHGEIISLPFMKERQMPNYIRHHFKGAENIGDII